MRKRVEWPTLVLILLCYAVWALALFALPDALWLAVPLVAITAAFHSSLTHEVVHGHPTPWPRVNAALVWPVLVLIVPFARFGDTHLAHHHDAVLTDPYDDPESNYLDAGVWERLPGPVRALLAFNNTLAGRLTVGPLVGQVAWMLGDARAIRAGDRAVLRGWLVHLPPMAVVLAVVWASPMPVWAYLLAVWMALGLLKIRTFLEHQAHEKARGRTVIIDEGTVVADGPSAELLRDEALLEAHGLESPYRLPA